MNSEEIQLGLDDGSLLAPTAWGDARPHSHLVQFYEDDGFLIDSLARWFSDGLSAGDACIFIGTEVHRIGLEKNLESNGFDLDQLGAEGRYLCLDAARTLAEFTVYGWPEEALFARRFEGLLATMSKQGNIRAFGEMVAVLWQNGNRNAAIRLEEIWNAFMKTHALSLCCAYPLKSFGTEADASLFMKVCAEHTPVLPAESFSALATPAERLRAVSVLQRKATALEVEKAGRKEAEASLELRQKELSDFFENAIEGLHQVGPGAKILWANPAQLELLGYTADEYVGHRLSEFYVDQNRFDEFWDRLMHRELIYDFPAALRCKNGSIKHVLIHSSGRWEDGKFTYTRCFIRDVTERVELEGELDVRLAELAQADQRKNEFLAMLGHELRNPLSAVLDSIVTAQLDRTRGERALTIARRQTEQLAGLVDDLLDIGRITKGRIELKKELLLVGCTLRQVVEEAHSLVDPGRHQLSVIVSPQAENVSIEADPARLRQLIANLLHNAAKFTPPGGRIEVMADRKDDEVVFRVRDSGMGITAELLPHIFDLFTQAERSLDRSRGGMGIGLTLVKRLVEMHGGHVEAKSEGLGMGSEFEVHFPIAMTAPPEAIATVLKPQAVKRLRVLVVEDNRDASEALAMLLELYGHDAIVFSDGPKAIEAVSKDVFDLALLDIGLPGMDGYEVARRIRMLPRSKPMLLVALTGYGQESDKQRALAAGFDEHLTKPVKIEQLQALLTRAR